MNAICKQRVKKQFGRQAKTYDVVASVQRRMAQGLIERLRGLGPCPRILEIGCGTGYLTSLLLEAFPASTVRAFDIAEPMVEAARRRCPSSRLEVYTADGEEAPREGEYDLIISNAVFQWFTRPAETTGAWVDRLAEGGLLAVATFGERTFRELHEAFAMAARALGLLHWSRPGQAFPALEWWQENLARLPVDALALWEAEHPTYHRSAREFLRTVKAMGASNAAKKHQTPARRELLLEMLRCYDGSFGSARGVVATYHEVGFLVRKKPL